MKKVKRRKDEGTILQRYKKSFFHAVDGVIYGIENEQNILIMMIAAVLVLVLGFFLPLSMGEIMLLLVLIAAILACEMINTAIEATIDLITMKDHPLAKVAKDCGSAASLLLCFASLICGVIIFVPKILALF